MLSWEELKTACGACRKCGLHETRENVVFGVGNASSEVLFVGEGPGMNEDKKGEPFVGRAGALLDDMLKIISLYRTDNIYITNIVKCRPPGNRDPSETECRSCIDWLRAQYSLIKPKIVVALGRIAATRLISPDFKISHSHGTWSVKDNVRFFALYHPSALLRYPRLRPDTFTDLKELHRVIKEIAPDTYGTGDTPWK